MRAPASTGCRLADGYALIKGVKIQQPCAAGLKAGNIVFAKVPVRENLVPAKPRGFFITATYSLKGRVFIEGLYITSQAECADKSRSSHLYFTSPDDTDLKIATDTLITFEATPSYFFPEKSSRNPQGIFTVSWASMPTLAQVQEKRQQSLLENPNQTLIGAPPTGAIRKGMTVNIDPHQIRALKRCRHLRFPDVATHTGDAEIHTALNAG